MPPFPGPEQASHGCSPRWGPEERMNVLDQTPAVTSQLFQGRSVCSEDLRPFRRAVLTFRHGPCRRNPAGEKSSGGQGATHVAGLENGSPAGATCAGVPRSLQSAEPPGTPDPDPACECERLSYS